MSRFAALLLCLTLAGCGIHKRPIDRREPVKPSPVKPVPETVLSLLADHIVSKQHLYDSTDFAMIVANHLLESKDITPEQHEKIKVLIGAKRRPLTQQDADAIRGL